MTEQEQFDTAHAAMREAIAKMRLENIQPEVVVTIMAQYFVSACLATDLDPVGITGLAQRTKDEWLRRDSLRAKEQN